MSQYVGYGIVLRLNECLQLVMGLLLMGIDNSKTGGPKPEVFPTDDLRNYK